MVRQRLGRIELEDGTVLLLRIAIAGVKYLGPSPFCGANFGVKVLGGVSVLSVPDAIKESLRDKPVLPPGSKIPGDGWELISIKSQDPAYEEVRVTVDNHVYLVSVEAEVTMVSRNLNYRNEFGEPIYWVSWVNKIRWRRAEG